MKHVLVCILFLSSSGIFAGPCLSKSPQAQRNASPLKKLAKHPSVQTGGADSSPSSSPTSPPYNWEKHLSVVCEWEVQ